MSIYRLEAPRCQHVKDDSIRCGSPALRGKPFCYQHSRVHQPRFRPDDRGYVLPPLETPQSVTQLSELLLTLTASEQRMSLSIPT